MIKLIRIIDSDCCCCACGKREHSRLILGDEAESHTVGPLCLSCIEQLKDAADVHLAFQDTPKGRSLT